MLAVTRGGSFNGSTVLTKISTAANCDGSPSRSYLAKIERDKIKMGNNIGSQSIE